MNEEQLWEMNYKPYPGTYQSNMDKKSIQRGDEKKSRPFNNSVPQASNLDNQEDEINHSFKKEVKRNYLDQSEGSSYMYPNRRYYKKRPRSSMKPKIDRASYEKIVDLQPVEGGDNHYLQVNITTMDKIVNTPIEENPEASNQLKTDITTTEEK